MLNTEINIGGRKMIFPLSLLIITAMVLSACGDKVSGTKPTEAQTAQNNPLPTLPLVQPKTLHELCDQFGTISTPDNTIQFEVPLHCGNSFISSTVVKINPADNDTVVGGQSSIIATRGTDGEINGCEVADVEITGNNITAQEYEAIIKKEFNHVAACEELNQAGVLQNYDTAKLGVQDATGGLGAIKGVIDGGAFIELEREDSQSTEFLLGPGVPDAIQNLVNSAASRPFLTCDQVNMIDIFIDNGITFPPITPPGLRASVCN